MFVNVMKSKIHRAKVTDANLDYVGSITIDKELIDRVGIKANEKVQIVNNNNGARFETYVIPGEPGKRDVCLNGAASRLVQPGDIIIIIAYCWLNESDMDCFEPSVLLLDGNNQELLV